jgi:aspartyl/asparaginyl beta-hydroxylase (cupin superfamily)
MNMLPPYDNTPGWYRSEDFEFNRLVQAQWTVIRDEALACLAAGIFEPHEQSREFQGTTRYSRHKLADQWHAFFLRSGPRWQEVACEQAPVTHAVMASIDAIQQQTDGRIYFSHIPAHGAVAPHGSGLPVGRRVRHQLCLMCDGTATPDQLWIEVNGDRRGWQPGQIISFDDHFRHSVSNHTNHPRMVLLYDSV